MLTFDENEAGDLVVTDDETGDRLEIPCGLLDDVAELLERD